MISFDGPGYQARFDALAADGVDVHGEAALVADLGGTRILDAGCGTGRVAIELARRGFSVVGVDVDRSMLAEARRRAPDLTWVEADLAGFELPGSFDTVVLAGNVPLFCPVPERHRLVASCAAHVGVGGRLVAGFQLDRDYDLAEWDEACAAAGLDLEDRWSTWARTPFTSADTYAVSVHVRTGQPT